MGQQWFLQEELDPLFEEIMLHEAASEANARKHDILAVAAGELCCDEVVGFRCYGGDPSPL